MDVKLKNFVSDMKDKWVGLDKQQRIKLIVATSLILITFVSTLYIMLKPKMVPIITGSDVVTINQLQEALTSMGIESKKSANGRELLVREEDAVSAEVVMATDTTIGNNEHLTFEDAFDLVGLGTTESVKAEALRRATEGEISNDLEAFDGVESATVKLATPEDNQFFLENADPATASVHLNLSKPIDEAQAEAIARFVAGSVVGLEPQNVTVLDSKAEILYSGDAESGVNRQRDIEEQKQYDIEQNVKRQLAPLYNDIEVTSTIKFDWDKALIDQTIYQAPNEESPNTGIINSESNSKESVKGGSGGSAPGTNSNGGTEIYGSTNSGQSAEASSSVKEYKLNEIKTTTEKATGGIVYDESSLAVMAYNYVYYDEQSMLKNGQLEDMTWEEFKLQTTATPIEIDESIKNSIATGTGIENVVVSGYVIPKFIDKVKTPPQVKEIIMLIVLAILILLLAILIIRNTQVEEVEEVEPELSVEDLLVSTRVEEDTEAEEAEAIKIKQENAMKVQIEKFVTERPDAAAQLLRNWLNEDWE